MIGVWIGLALAGVILALGHARLLDRQADVAAARRRLEALWQQRERAVGARRAMLDARIESIRRVHAAELTRYRATPGARINRWRPKALPETDTPAGAAVESTATPVDADSRGG